MDVPAEPDKTATSPAELPGLQQRYDKARDLLEYHLLADTQYKKDNHAPISTAIKARHAAAEALKTSSAQEAKTALKDLEDALRDFPPADAEMNESVTGRFDRFIAWYNGDHVATVPPALPEPPPEEDHKPAPKKKATAKGKKQKTTAPNTTKLKAPTKEVEAPAPTKPKRWIRRIAAMLLLAAVISGLRLADRRAELANALAIDVLVAVRSVEQVQFWFKAARWFEVSGILYRSLAHDTQVASAGISRRVAELLEDPDARREESEAALAALLARDKEVQEQQRRNEITALRREAAEWETRYGLLEQQLIAVQVRLAEAEQKRASADEDGNDAFLRLEYEFVQRDQQAKALEAELEQLESRLNRIAEREIYSKIIIESLETLVDTTSQKAVWFVQNRLIEFGYDPGAADGKIGQKTRDAIREYQRAARFPVTGEITPELITALARYSDG